MHTLIHSQSGCDLTGLATASATPYPGAARTKVPGCLTLQARRCCLHSHQPLFNRPLANVDDEEGLAMNMWLVIQIPRTASPIYNVAIATALAESIADPAPGALPAPMDVSDKPASPISMPTPNDEPQNNAPVRRGPHRLRKRLAAPVLVALPAHPLRLPRAIWRLVRRVFVMPRWRAPIDKLPIRLTRGLRLYAGRWALSLALGCASGSNHRGVIDTRVRGAETSAGTGLEL
ncbi:hypothetical protein FRC09_001701 [Ceratobasidium sp. 395]|nr:hypothetical protein FRC09_001701 [Ceratobasidium sp. 395]